LARFIDLLRRQGVQLVADVRSQPYSRRWPQYQREPFKRDLARAGLSYHFLGAQLGGRPPESELYDESDRPDYERVRETERFAAGFVDLVQLATRSPIVLMCAEEDPVRCHRHLLIAPALLTRGFQVLHIRGDGRTQSDDGLSPQLDLF
jgi:uncharacterized protein (DUF488 family)